MRANYRDLIGMLHTFRLSGESVSFYFMVKGTFLDLKSKKLGIKFQFGIEKRSQFNFRALVHYLAEIQRREKEMKRLNMLMNSNHSNDESESRLDLKEENLDSGEKAKSPEMKKDRPKMMKFID